MQVRPVVVRLLVVVSLLAPFTGQSPSAATTSAATVDEPPVVAVTLNRARFSPNGDGNADLVTARVTLSERVRLTVEVRRSGTVLDTLLVADRGPNPVSVTWDGRTAAGRRVGDGPVELRATAADAAFQTAADSVAVSVDTTGPRFAWLGLTPEPQYGTGMLTATFRVSGEAAVVAARTEALDRFGVRARHPTVARLPGDRRLGWRPTYPDGTYLFPGLYRMRFVLRDDVGNVTTGPVRAFRVHRPVLDRAVEHLAGAGHRVALTFDGCYEPEAWSRILGILRTRGVHASFFCVSSNVSRYPQQARRTVADGHTVGGHTPDHPHVIGLTSSAIIDRLRRDQATWWRVARVTPSPFWRVPYGEHSPTAEAAAGRAGFRWTVFWAVDTIDWEYPGVATVTSRALRAGGGDIVLMHVLGDTADALPGIISGLRSRGLRPVSLEELFHATGADRP